MMYNSSIFCGWVAERSNAAVLKTVVGATPPGVRIPHHPPGIIKAPTKSVGALFLGGLLALFCHKVTSMYNDVNLLIFMMDMLQ